MKVLSETCRWFVSTDSPPLPQGGDAEKNEGHRSGTEDDGRRYPEGEQGTAQVHRTGGCIERCSNEIGVGAI